MKQPMRLDWRWQPHVSTQLRYKCMPLACPSKELRKFALGMFDHLADKSDGKPSFQEFLENHTAVFRQDLLF